MAIGLETRTPIINEVLTGDNVLYLPPFGTTNNNKKNEIAAALGVTTEELDFLSVPVPEIQSRSPEEVAEAKARAAYELTGRPVIIEDTSLLIHALEHKCPAPHVKWWAGTSEGRRDICEETQKRGDNRALAKTIFAVYDGRQVHKRTGYTTGTISAKPRGEFAFGWDDMFEPNGQEVLELWDGTRRTFAEMTLAEKQQLSMRQEALRKIEKEPFALGKYVFALAESEQMELDAIDPEFFRGEGMERARKHAFGLRVLDGIEENEELEVDIERLRPFHEIRLHNGIIQYTHDPDSPDLGFIVTSYELRKALDGSPTRLVVNDDGRPTLLQHGKRSLKRALAARALEFAMHHNDDVYTVIREMLNGRRTEPRPNIPSPIIDGMLHALRASSSTEVPLDDDGVDSVPGFSMLAYARQYSENPTSRTEAAKQHIINRNGIPTSMLALGGMPPVTGSRDTVTSAALSFMRSYIPHNSLFANFNRRLALFKESKEYVENLIDEEQNQDMQDLCVRQIGVCMSGTNMEQITSEAKKLVNAGCRSIRIYTTNPGPEVPESVRTIGEIVRQKRLRENESLPFHICVGPIVDYNQGQEIRQIAEEFGIALTFLVGHGGGENCTSLAAGAAANSFEIMQDFITDEEFNKVALGFEGGLGELFGPWLGLIDVISKNGSIVRGTVESQGGLLALHKDGRPVQMYAGTASPTTLMVEHTLCLASRTNKAGQIRNDEGKPNFMTGSRWAPSMTHFFWHFRSLLGRAMADQRAGTIDDIIKNIKAKGHNHRKTSNSAFLTAKAHRGN